MSAPQILVTGAAGFIGSHTVDRLLAEGARVLGIDDLSTGREENLSAAAQNPGFSLETQCLRDERRVCDLVKKFRPDAIVHLAALVSVPIAEQEPLKNWALNVETTHHLAEAARLFQIRRIVFASSAAIYGDNENLPLRECELPRPLGQYGMSKLVGETLLRGYTVSYGLSPICFRYFNVFGPRQDPNSPYSGVVSIFVDRFRSQQAITIFGDGCQSRDFIFVGDIAEGNARAAVDPNLPSGVFNRCTGSATTLLDLVDALHEVFAKSVPVHHEAPRIGDIRHSLGDPSHTERELQLTAGTTFSQGIRALVDSL